LHLVAEIRGDQPKGESAKPPHTLKAAGVITVATAAGISVNHVSDIGRNGSIITAAAATAATGTTAFVAVTTATAAADDISGVGGDGGGGDSGGGGGDNSLDFAAAAVDLSGTRVGSPARLHLFHLGSLLAQLSVLFAGVKCTRKIVRTYGHLRTSLFCLCFALKASWWRAIVS
jgi:hypothetical protein